MRVYSYVLGEALSEDEIHRFRQAVDAFPRVIKQRLGFDVFVDTLPMRLDQELSRCLQRSAACLAEYLDPVIRLRNDRSATLHFSGGDSLCILCDVESLPARLAVAENSMAMYGAELDQVVLVYHLGDGGATVWHELLHCLGAEECYGEGGVALASCAEDECVMRYGSTIGNYGELVICETNARRITERR